MVPQLPQFALLDCVLTQLLIPPPFPNGPKLAAHWVSPDGQLHWVPASVVTQLALIAHEFPQAPQFWVFELRSAHTVEVLPFGPVTLHAVSPASPHPVVHAPLWHVCPIVHRVPHTPQLLLSVDKLVHVLPHFVELLEHVHSPLTQVPPVQVAPQDPQLLELDVRSTHDAPHWVSAVPASLTLHLVEQVPLLHTATPPSSPPSEVHEFPHDPQLFGSVSTDMQVEPQRAMPLAHWHEPAAHVSTLLHRVLHPPQLPLSVCSLTQDVPHCDVPDAQVHFPEEQTNPVPQETPHPPQFLTSASTGMQPPLQYASPLAEHVHAPETQAAPLPHTIPQPPQLLSSACSFTQEPLQRDSPFAHSVAQMPELQKGVPPEDVHTVPQLPQLSALEYKSTHWFEHSAGFVPPAHSHAPPTHCSLAVHAVEQPPQ